jgi:hypothetical protein
LVDPLTSALRPLKSMSMATSRTPEGGNDSPSGRFKSNQRQVRFMGRLILY